MSFYCHRFSPSGALTLVRAYLKFQSARHSNTRCVAARGQGVLMNKLGLSVAFVTAATIASADMVYAADMNAMVAKAAPASYAPPPAACGSVYDFFLTACPLSWYGVSFYGTVDVGGGYQSHGAPFDRNFPTGASYLIGAGGTGATNRTPGWYLAPNGLSQSNVGFRVREQFAPDWAFVAQAGLAFDPYSALLGNAPQAMQNGIGIPQNQQAIPFDSSRWGWLADQIYVGTSSGTYGTLTFGRQNTLYNDAIVAYDPMGASYAFSPIGFSGKAAGGGDTEDARWTTAIKYRENIGPVRLAVMGQPGFGYGAYNPNQGAVGGQLGGDIKNLGWGTLSLDALAVWEKDAVNISPAYIGQATANGWPTTFPGGAASGLKATLSNQTSVMVVAKYSFGSWGNPPPPVVSKAAPPPSGPTGIPLTLYAGYEWIQFQNPSDPQTSTFRDDGFQFSFVNTAATALNPTNSTTIANANFGTGCTTTAGLSCSAEIFHVFWAGAKYGITKDLDVIGAYYHYIQDQYLTGPASNTAANCTSSGFSPNNSKCAGYLDAISGVIDWRFLPKWDTYVGVMYSAAFGGIANGDIQRNNVAVTGGVRLRF
jgi:predicted porin